MTREEVRKGRITHFVLLGNDYFVDPARVPVERLQELRVMRIGLFPTTD